MHKRSMIFTLVFIIILMYSLNIQSFALNYWKIYNEGEAAMNNLDYTTAIEKYESIIEIFKGNDDYVNTALLFSRLGKCYAELSKFDNAEYSWRMEAKYWEKAGKEQETIAANRKAGFVKTKIRLFTEVNSDIVGEAYYHGAKYEPVLGAYLGAYAENDPEVHDPYKPRKFYIDKFPELTEKNHAAYLLYMTYGMKFNHYRNHFERAQREGVAIQLALQPMNGLDEVKDDKYLREFAKDAAKVKIPIFLRFANEMNDPTSNWYVEPEKYIEKFRIVSNVFHEEAENVVMVWAPNSFPPNNITDYYPGDEYVDWVGLSLYKAYLPELDPLNKNIDRESFVEKLDAIYKHYADKKPLFISEGGVSYTNFRNGEDITQWASKQLENFYSYIPMLYPGIKGIFYYDSNDVRKELNVYRSYLLSKNEEILKSYKQAIGNEFYLSEIDNSSPVFFADVEKYGLAPRTQRISAYVKTPDPNVNEVIFKINGEVVGKSNKVPWTFEYNFKGCAGQNIAIEIEVYGEGGYLISKKAINAYVGSVNLSMNNKSIDLESQAKLVNNKTFLPVDSIIEKSGGTIERDIETKSFIIKNKDMTLKMSIGSNLAIFNGENKTIEAPPFIYNNKLYLPLRFICEEVLGYTVERKPETLTIVLK